MWKIGRAWCWASGPPPADLPSGRGGLWDTPGLLDLDEALAAGWEPLAFVPSVSSYGGFMILRRWAG